MMMSFAFRYCFLVFNILAVTLSPGQTLTDSLRGGELAFEKTTHDFGDVKKGPKVNGEFRFRNTGTDTVVISHIGTQCGCTVPSWDKAKKYPPGEEGSFNVEFDSNRKMGPVVSPIHIFYDDYRKKKMVNIRINVIQP